MRHQLSSADISKLMRGQLTGMEVILSKEMINHLIWRDVIKVNGASVDREVIKMFEGPAGKDGSYQS